MIHAAASARTESRGAHLRRDAPVSDPAQASRRAFRFVASPSSPSLLDPNLRSLSSC
jgi:L-aspartate oxidase